MKVFFGVFFGILAAAGVLYLVIYLKQLSDRQEKIDEVKRNVLLLSEGCKDYGVGTAERSDLEDQIERGEDALRELDSDGDPAGWMIREAALENQILANGCFQRNPPAPVGSHKRK